MQSSRRLNPVHIWGMVVSILVAVGIVAILLKLNRIEQDDRDDKPDQAHNTADGAEPAPQVPIPEQPGLWPLVDGKLIPHKPTTEPLDLPPTVQFVFFHKRVPTFGKEARLFLLPMGIASSKPLIFPRTTLADAQPEIGAYLPGGAIEIYAKVRAVRDNPEMIHISFTKPLEPGYYALEDWALFYVDRQRLEQNATGLVGRWYSPFTGSGDITWSPAKQPKPTRPSASFHFSKDGTYTARIQTAERSLNEQGTWKLSGKQLITTTTASDDGRPVGTVDTVEVLKLDASQLVFKAPTASGNFMTHTFQRIN